MRSQIWLFLSVLLVVVSSNLALACEKHNSDDSGFHKNEAKKASCCSETSEQQDANIEDHTSQTSKECPCDHQHGGCHCPGCAVVTGTTFGLTPTTPESFSLTYLHDALQRQAFYFAEHLPEAVYLSIWQPPKISV